MFDDQQKHQRAQELAQCLAEKQLRIVWAESCSAGNVAGALAIVPGISAWLCGSFVVYRNESKASWLSISRNALADPNIGPVSAQVTQSLAQRALAVTSEADIGAAVTGHIGPGSPAHLDGQLFFALVRRGDERVVASSARLQSKTPRDQADVAARLHRLNECTAWVLEQATLAISNAEG